MLRLRGGPRRSANKPWKRSRQLTVPRQAQILRLRRRRQQNSAMKISPGRNQEQSKPISPRKRTSLKLFSPANGGISGLAKHAASRFLEGASCAWIANLRGRYKTQPLRHFFPSSLRRKKAGCTRTSIQLERSWLPC